MNNLEPISLPRYSCRYERSSVHEWLDDFDEWLASQAYNRTSHRMHVSVVQYVLQQLAPLDEGRVFGSDELTQMFQPFEGDHPRRGTAGVFRRFLKGLGQWRDDTPAGPCADLVEAFRQSGKEMRGLSSSHLRRQCETVDDFLRKSLVSRRSFAEINMGDVEAYVIKCGEVLERVTVMKRVCTLRAFFRFCRNRGVACLNPDLMDASRQYRHDRPPRAIAWELTLRLLDSIDRSSLMGERDYTLLYLMAHFGLRTGEAAKLTLDSINWSKHTLRINQNKTRSTLVLPLPSQAEEVLQHYVRHGRPVTERRELFLVLAAPIRPMLVGTIGVMFRRRVEASGLPLRDASPYGLRHGFAMRLLERGVGMKVIGDLMGHSALDSTSVYLRLHTEALRCVALPLPATPARRAA